jgi:hypothetical protein
MENQTKDSAGAPSVESLVKRGYLFLEDSDWNKADEYFDKALDINPEHAPAYIGKLCAELRVRREESLGDDHELRQGKIINRPLGEYANFQKAIRFADGGYKKKLNGYDQKTKESIPKVPQRFTDEFIKGEIARLGSEIANCDAEIAKGEKDGYDARENLSSLRKEERRFIDIYLDDSSIYAWGRDGAMERMKNDPSYKRNKELMEQEYSENTDAIRRVDEYKEKKARYEARKQELEQLAGISNLDRMDYHYNRLAEAMKKEATEDGFRNLAEQFRSLEGYKDSAELADKCGKLAIKARDKAQYDKLVLDKNNAKTEEEYRELSKQFRKMGSYDNSAQLAEECDKLADECVKQKEREKKARYDALVQEKNSASSEDKYKQLAEEFRKMGNYENTVQLANECDKQMNVLKKQHEEQERQKQARAAAIEAQKKAEEAKQERKKKQKWKIGIFLQLLLCAAYLFILYGTEIISEPWLGRATFIGYLPFIIFSLAIGMVSLIFKKKSDSVSGILILIVMILVQSITTCVWRGGVGFLFVNLIFRAVMHILCAIPGAIFAFFE